MGKTLFSHKCYEKILPISPCLAIGKYGHTYLVTTSDSQASACLLLVLGAELELHHERLEP